MIASLSFPDKPEAWPILDDYFWQIKRFVFLSTCILFLLINVGVSALGLGTEIPPEYLEQYPAFRWATLLTALTLPWMIWAGFSKSRKVNISLLVYYIISNMIYLIVTMYVPHHSEFIAS